MSILVTVTNTLQKTCKWCEQSFVRKSNRGPHPTYCSAACRQRAYESRKAREAVQVLDAALAAGTAVQNFPVALSAPSKVAKSFNDIAKSMPTVRAIHERVNELSRSPFADISKSFAQYQAIEQAMQKMARSPFADISKSFAQYQAIEQAMQKIARSPLDSPFARLVSDSSGTLHQLDIGKNLFGGLTSLAKARLWADEALHAASSSDMFIPRDLFRDGIDKQTEDELAISYSRLEDQIDAKETPRLIGADAEPAVLESVAGQTTARACALAAACLTAVAMANHALGQSAADLLGFFAQTGVLMGSSVREVYHQAEDAVPGTNVITWITWAILMRRYMNSQDGSNELG